ncbi:MAG: FAD-binding oxidoreductase [Deltaproteobacteria bacterium]|nr:FAD-binding oxidoreductase [Deltaproteobacteria bacterium]MBW2136502.1 FAD-binding oxidoreductase [Deltaproteobacteria bacterium]
MSETLKIADDLAGIVGEAHVMTAQDQISQYSVDGVAPGFVVFPKDIEQVSETVKYANEKDLAIVPWGGGSKMSFGNPPERLDIVLCMSGMNHMKDVDVANLTLTVEAGVKLLDIQARLATEDDRCYLPLHDLGAESGEMICSDRSHSGCFLPIDAPFGRQATIGGVIASNSSGPRRLLYNLPRDLILGSRFVAPNGDIIESGGKTVKNVSGYDISKLMIGSAGTLGILCEVTLRVLPLPEKMETLLFSFGNFQDASGLCDLIHESNLLPAAVELMNDRAHGFLRTSDMTGLSTGPYMVAVALEAFSEAVDRMGTEIREMARRTNRNGEASIYGDQHSLFWLAVSELVPALAMECKDLVSARLIYPISCWKEIIRLAERNLSQEGLDGAFQVHTGSGVSMVNILLNGNGSKKTTRVLQGLLSQCRNAGGNLVVHRAPGEMKRELPVWGEPGTDLILMKRIKRELDPKGVMSPGRFIGGL